jgi:tRNA (cytidine/uridine-2'-O-)-methyltransferase
LSRPTRPRSPPIIAARLRLALFEPDIPQNAATLLRTAACLGVAVDIIEPCGFLFGDRQFRRAGMDYLDRVDLARHASWPAFRAARADAPAGRLVLLTTQADTAHLDFRFAAADTLLVGRESGGVPESVHAAADARLRIPMLGGARSLNVAVAAAMALAEALRQTGGFPHDRG